MPKSAADAIEEWCTKLSWAHLAKQANVSAFSYTYNKLKDNLNDSFIKKGNGLGITYNYNFIPMRIDYILLSKDFRVNKFKTYKINLSDHEPIFSEIIF